MGGVRRVLTLEGFRRGSVIPRSESPPLSRQDGRCGSWRVETPRSHHGQFSLFHEHTVGPGCGSLRAAVLQRSVSFHCPTSTLLLYPQCVGKLRVDIIAQQNLIFQELRGRAARRGTRDRLTKAVANKTMPVLNNIPYFVDGGRLKLTATTEWVYQLDRLPGGRRCHPLLGLLLVDFITLPNEHVVTLDDTLHLKVRSPGANIAMRNLLESPKRWRAGLHTEKMRTGGVRCFGRRAIANVYG